MIKNSLLTLTGRSGRGCVTFNPRSYLQHDSNDNPQQSDQFATRDQRQTVESSDNGDSEVFSSHQCDDVEYTYVMPITKNAGYNFLAESIKTKDFNNVRIVVICEHPSEAKEMMSELGKRGVACLLLNVPNELLQIFVDLWTESLLNSVLVTCDSMLQLLAGCANLKADFLIHSTQPLPHVFQKRIQALIQTNKRDTKVLIIKAPARTTAVNPKTIEVEKIAKVLPEKVKVETIESEMHKKVTSIPTKESKATLGECAAEDNPSTVESLPSEIQDLKITDKKPQAESEFIYRNFGILAWSRYKQVSCFSIRDTKIDSRIKDAMKELGVGHVRAKSVQRYAWPHLATGRSLCVIGNETTGKTWCYLPWICDRLIKDLSQQQQQTKSGDCGPRSIIVCAGAKQGEQIADLCLQMLGKALEGNDMKNLVIKLFERHKIHEVANELKRPCGILITNVDFMLQLWPLHTKAAPIFNRTAIRSVAIDNLDVMWRCVRLDSEKVFKWLTDFLQFDEDHTQMLIASRLWSEMLMHHLMSKLPDILLLFEDALEATVYGGIKLDMLFTLAEQCDGEIVELVKTKMAKKERQVVICQTNEDALYLSNLLCRVDINNSIVDNPNKDKACSQWCSDGMSSRVLIVTDNAVPKLRGESIDCLIHYNSASGWARFKARFGLFFGNFKPQQPKMENASSVIIVRPQDSELIWFICDFMLKHDRIVPDSWLHSLTTYRIKMENIKPRPDHPLCRQLLGYGNCCRRTCQYRHTLWDYEVGPPPNHPTRGEIRFHVLLTISPSQLAVKLADFEISTYFLNVPLTKLGESIQLHYEDPENRKRHHDPKLADICIVRINKQYQRVGVTRVESDRIEVKQLDAGVDFVLVNEADLLLCDERFYDKPFEANDVRITGLIPFNMERIWPEDCKHLVRKKFFNRQPGKPYRVYTAKVDFAFHEMIFVENVYDEEGNDLKSFVLNNMQVHMDDSVKNRLKYVASLAKPFLIDET